MTTLQWDVTGSRSFQTGLDRGVLYLNDGGAVPWNGLISVAQDQTTTASPIYYDGRKISDVLTSTSFKGRIRAFTYPDEFLAYEGVIEDSAGLLIAEQPFKRFNLSFRTKVGSDTEGIDKGYQIHLLYDVAAIPSQKSHRTLALDVDPLEFEWTITTIPQEISGFRPTAHVIIDSTKVPSWFMEDIEEIIYGTDTLDPYLPALESIAAYFRNWDRILITDNLDGTWTAVTTNETYIVDRGGGEFEINNANAVFIDTETYEISSTDKSEGDLWQP